MKKRYVIYICLVLMIIFGSFLIPPVLPTIQLPGEVVVKWPGGSEFLGGLFGSGLTNTYIATLLTYAVIIIMVLALKPRSRTADEVPTGFYNFFEMIIEGAYGYVQGASGKWAKNFFPFFMTFILFILVANWMELIPGIDSIGVKEDLVHHNVELAEETAEAQGEHLTEAQVEAIATESGQEGGKYVGLFLLRAEEDEEAGQQVVPFVRAAATDLNFTIALALISVVITQYYGLKALGAGYLRKFWAYDADKISRNPLGLMDVAVGLLELISEIAKILSFSFRLFGNIFAGQVLLFIISFLVGVAYLAVAGFEFLIGLLQALIFAVLTLTFMAGAIVSHDDEH